MPSSSQQNGHASTSSSRLVEQHSSHSRSSRDDRAADDKHRRPPSPDTRHRSHRDTDRRHSSDLKRDDDRRHPSGRYEHDARYADESDRSRRGERSARSPPPRDPYYSKDERRYEANHDRYRAHRHDSPEYSTSRRRLRSPDPARRREYGAADPWDVDSNRAASRRSGETWDPREPHWSGRPYEYDDWRNERSSARDDRHHRDREPYRSARHEHDYETSYRKNDYARDSRLASSRRSRSRSRSRSRDRHRNRSRERRRERSREGSRTGDSRRDERPSTTEIRSHSAKRDEATSHLNGRSEDGKILKREPQPDAPEMELSASDRWDIELGEVEQDANAAPISRDPTSSRAPRPQQTDTDVRTSLAPNGSASSSSRPDRPRANGSDRRSPRPSSSKETEREWHTSPSTRPSPQSAQTSTQKNAAVERSFGHVPLPHEIPAERRGKNYMATAAYKEGVKIVYKSVADKQLIDANTRDPRRTGKKSTRYREALHTSTFKWDSNSRGSKPLPRPRNLVLTNLASLTQPHQILPLIHPHGRIESSKLELDPKIGQSIGIFWVKFAHDLDEHGKPLESVPADQKPQDGAKAATAAYLALNGSLIGNRCVQAFLDRNGELVAAKVKDKLAEGESKSQRPAVPPPAPAAKVSSSPATPGLAKPSMPPPQIPRGPKAFASPSYASSSPSTRGANADRYEHSSSSHPRYRGYEDDRKPAASDPYHRRRGTEEYSSYRSKMHADPQVPTGPRSEARRKSKKSDEAILSELRDQRRPYVYIPRPRNCDIDVEAVEAQLRSTEPVWVQEGDKGFYAAFYTTQGANQCKIVNETLTIGGYTLQLDVRAAPTHRAPIQQTRPASSMSTAASLSKPAPASQPCKTIDTGLRPLTAEEKQKTDWTEAELQDAVFRMLQKELADTFIRDVKSRVVGPHLSSYLKPDGQGGQMLAKATLKKTVVAPRTNDRAPTASEAQGDVRLPSFRKLAGTQPKKQVSKGDSIIAKTKRDRTESSKQGSANRSKSHRVRDILSSDDGSEDTEHEMTNSTRRDSRTKSKSSTKRRGAAAWLLEGKDDEADSDDAVATEHDATSRSVSASVEPGSAEQIGKDATAKGAKGAKAKAVPTSKRKGTAAARKSAHMDGTPSEAEGEADRGSETVTPETEVAIKAAAAKAKSKSAKASAKAKPIPADPFEAGLVEDGEDCYYLRLALEHLSQTGELASEETLPDEVELEAEAEEQAMAAGAIPKHSTGSARTEGYYRIPPEQKAMHLPDRNKATEDVDSSSNAHVLQSARNNRADSRRLVLGIEQHKRETATDTDMFKFNQLRTRKKQLKFAKSPIHDWGLYAMELIPAGDMVIEYVGEVVRQQVADEREKQYERQGNFSTYLFRVDDDLVVDATHKGNIARLMNHCCTPNCNAKILTLNGEKRIVLFAKTAIRAGEELTYDYKFQSSADDEDAIPCLCGSPGCRRFL